tara:strand:- start:2055 stop:2477 length:423 start_codon:yes stop_codon:yes gene_type:complete
MSILNLNDIEVPADLNFLIVEDTVIFQKKMVQTLNDLGFTGNVTVAGTLEEGYKSLSEKKPDFILSDWNLPDGVGIDFLKKVRSDEKYNQTPFVMVTTMDAIDDILDAAKIGSDDYIIKPWEEDEFSVKISTSYEKRKKL